MPASIGLPSLEIDPRGVWLGENTVQGQTGPVTVINATLGEPAPDPGVSTLPPVSDAWLLIVTVPCEVGSHVKVHGLVPVAGIHVTPPSVDTATPATTPPLVSEDVP